MTYFSYFELISDEFPCTVHLSPFLLLILISQLEQLGKKDHGFTHKLILTFRITFMVKKEGKVLLDRKDQNWEYKRLFFR